MLAQRLDQDRVKTLAVWSPAGIKGQRRALGLRWQAQRDALDLEPEGSGRTAGEGGDCFLPAHHGGRC